MAIQNTGFQENTVQRDKDTIVYAQFSGLRNDVDPERFDLGDMTVANNIDIDQTGRISRRPGYTLMRAGATHSMWATPNEDICMFVSGGWLHQMNDDFSDTALLQLVDGVSPMSYDRVNDCVYFSNGTDIGIVQNGVVRSWGLPVAPLPNVAATIGAMSAGTYQFNMVWLRADGQESGCGLNGTIQLDDSSGIDFTIPIAPSPDVVGAIIYISPANSDLVFEAIVSAPGQTVSWRSDPSSLSVPLATQFLGPPPAGHMVAFYRGHMFVAAGDTIFISQPYAYELFSMNRYIQFDSRVTMLIALSDLDHTEAGRSSGFFIGTERSTGILAGNNPDDFQYVKKADYGVVPGTVDAMDSSQLRDGQAGARIIPMWLSHVGVCVGMPDLAINNLTRGQYNFTAAGRGAALFIPNPARYIATHSL